MAKIGTNHDYQINAEMGLDEDIRPQDSKLLLVAAIPAGILLGSLAGLGIGSVINSKFVEELTASFSGPAVQTEIAEPAPFAPEVMNAFVWSVRIRLDDLGIGRMLRVASQGDRKLVITGTLTREFAGRYEIFKGWVMSQPDFPPLIDEVNILKASGEFPNIASVWLGDAPKLILENGTEAGIGETFGNDWTIVDIGAMAVILERPDGMMIELSYQEG